MLVSSSFIKAPVFAGSLKGMDISSASVKKSDVASIFARIQDKAVEPEKFSAAPANNSPDRIYTTVKVNGQVVATLYESGCAVTPNNVYGEVCGLPSMTEAETLTGPALAQKRAEEIAKALGGTIEKTALADTGKPYTAQTLVNAQLMAQEDEGVSSAKDEFMKFMASAKDGPGGMMRAQILKSLGLTEEDLNAMSPEERRVIEKKIEELIRKKIEEQQGTTIGSGEEL